MKSLITIILAIALSACAGSKKLTVGELKVLEAYGKAESVEIEIFGTTDVIFLVDSTQIWTPYGRKEGNWYRRNRVIERKIKTPIKN